MWIKICGNTNLEDARLAVEAGADALGFVFAPSPRRVTPAQAQRIIAELPPQVEKYGVFVDAPFAEIVSAVEACGLTGAQLHSPEKTLPSRLREYSAAVARKLSIVRVVSLAAQNGAPGIPSRAPGPDLDPDLDRFLDLALLEAGEEASGDGSVDAVLVDSSTASAAGGTGIRFDWAAAQASFLRAAGQVRIILAGGLRPENVERAISTLRPWGVDVVSGVEATPGKKDPARLLAFFQAVRQAEGGLAGQGFQP
jgi:phosphoribosylanthranilate isomerase